MTKSPKSSKPQPKNSDSGHLSKSEERPAGGLFHVCRVAIRRVFKREASRPMSIPTGAIANHIQDQPDFIITETSKPLGEVMRYYRERRNLTQIQLSTRLKDWEHPVSESTIAMWETGRRIPKDPMVFLYYGKCLRLSIEEMLALGDLWLVAKSREPLELHQSYVESVNALTNSQPSSPDNGD